MRQIKDERDPQRQLLRMSKSVFERVYNCSYTTERSKLKKIKDFILKQKVDFNTLGRSISSIEWKSSAIMLAKKYLKQIWIQIRRTRMWDLSKDRPFKTLQGLQSPSSLSVTWAISMFFLYQHTYLKIYTIEWSKVPSIMISTPSNPLLQTDWHLYILK